MVGGVALKQLLGGEHHLVRGLAPTAAATHAVSHDTQDATRDARVADQRDLVLLVFAVTLVDAG